MARQIDDSKPLSDDDRQWLKDWGRDAEIARIDAIHGTTPKAEVAQEDASKSDDLADLLRSNGIDPGEDAMEALRAHLGGRRGDPLGQGQAVVAPGQSGSYADGEPDSDEGSASSAGGYEDWTVDDLKDELGNRELSKSGNKAELIARLQEDDEDSDGEE